MVALTSREHVGWLLVGIGLGGSIGCVVGVGAGAGDGAGAGAGGGG